MSGFPPMPGFLPKSIFSIGTKRSLVDATNMNRRSSVESVPDLPPPRKGNNRHSMVPATTSVTPRPPSSAVPVKGSKSGKNSPPTDTGGYIDPVQVRFADDTHVYDKLMVEEDISHRIKSMETSLGEMSTEMKSLKSLVENMSKQMLELTQAVQASSRTSTQHQLPQQQQQQQRQLQPQPQLQQQPPKHHQLLQQQNKDNRLERCENHTAIQGKKHHTHEWEVPNVDNLSKSQREINSPTYLLEELNFKMIAEVQCTSEGAMRVKVRGEFTEIPDQPINGKFECSIHVLDKPAQNLPDKLLGKVAGDVYKSKQWLMGEISIKDLKKKGYCGVYPANVHLRIDFDTFV